MKVIRVVCGIIYNNERILIARRRKGKSLAGKWEFPGGKVEETESEQEALIRELDEEFGMTIKLGSKIGEFPYDYQEISIVLIPYRCEYLEATMELTDHDKIAWVTTSEVFNFDLAEADIPILHEI